MGGKLQSEFIEGTGKAGARRRNAKAHRAHADRDTAIDVALLIIDEHAPFSADAERLNAHLVGARVGLQDAGVCGVDDDLEVFQPGQRGAEGSAVEQIQFVGQDGQPLAGTPSALDGRQRLGPDDGTRVGTVRRAHEVTHPCPVPAHHSTDLHRARAPVVALVVAFGDFTGLHPGPQRVGSRIDR